jgi:hypothetical protein
VPETFENQDLAEAVFHNVNLQKAHFEDVNLSSATIRNATLENFSIDDSYIKGLTISGFDIHQLISDELDRRDPERVRLRMTDRYNPENVRIGMQRLDEVRQAFHQALLATNPDLLNTRPAPGEWSVVEIVRHLLYSEDLFLNRRILGNQEPWNPLGLLPDFLIDHPAYAGVGSEPTEDIAKLLEAWEAIHAHMHAFVASVTEAVLRSPLRDLAYGNGTVGDVLQGMAHHDLDHIRQAEETIKLLQTNKTD